MEKRKEKNNIPIVDYKSVSTINHRYYRGGDYWEVYKLINLVNEDKLPIFELPLAGIDLNCTPFTVNNLDDMAWHMKRVQESDLKYPIILDDLGQICDGNHRVVKALVKGDKTIKAVRIQNMPTPDGHDE